VERISVFFPTIAGVAPIGTTIRRRKCGRETAE
jgi:hypothetical protein